MLDITDDLIRILAFQRGVLAMAKEGEKDTQALDKAIANMDLLIEDFSTQIS